MGRPGLLDLEGLDEIPSASGDYTEIEVVRSNTWVYSTGNEVYELTSPTGAVYVMQSYSGIVDSELTIGDLADLGTRLDLPEGWAFSSRFLEEDYELLADGVAIVLQDELLNTYQRR